MSAWLRATVVTYVLLLVALPMIALVYRGTRGGPVQFWIDVSTPAAVHAVVLTAVTSAAAACINAAAGIVIAWALVRHRFPGRKLLSSLVDVPFAVPTLVTGVLLVALYGPQSPVGRVLEASGVPIAFAQPGIVLALVFVTLPLAVRTIEPVLSGLDRAEEDAAVTLGASTTTVLVHVILPPLRPAIAAAWVQVFARALAEFGAIAAVSGNIPRHTQVASVYVLAQLESGSPRSAAAVSVVLLAVALLLQPLWQRLVRGGGGDRARR